jgi:hypothetical protein
LQRAGIEDVVGFDVASVLIALFVATYAIANDKYRRAMDLYHQTLSTYQQALGRRSGWMRSSREYQTPTGNLRIRWRDPPQFEHDGKSVILHRILGGWRDHGSPYQSAQLVRLINETKTFLNAEDVPQRRLDEDQKRHDGQSDADRLQRIQTEWDWEGEIVGILRSACVSFDAMAKCYAATQVSIVGIVAMVAIALGFAFRFL